jgi:hypothetical protein
MRRAALALVLAGLLAAPVGAGGDAISVVQESRTLERAKRQKKSTVEHVALLKNTSSRAVRALRVTVELYDSFGTLLWARTVTPGPSSLRPGETASLSLSTPHLESYKKTVYRFDYRTDPRPR